MRLLEVAREARKRIFYLSYAWRLTNDERYLHRAEHELLMVASFTDWNPSHFLDVAEMTLAVSIGYDWLFHDLGDSTKTIIRESILQKGIHPSYERDNNWWLTENNNWNQVCNAAMVIGSLAVYEDEPELARKTINRSITSIKLSLQEYEPDGAYPEGYMYWGYGTTFTIYMISTLEKVFKTDFELIAQTGLGKTGGYLLNMIGPSGQSFNYSDGDSKVLVNPAMYWFARHSKDYSLLYAEKETLTKSPGPIRDLPAVVIWGSSINMDSIPEPASLLWAGRGKNPVALLRSSWEKDGIYLGFKGGSPKIGHSHLDMGSFIFDAYGLRWAMDLGGQDYTALEESGFDLWSLDQKSQRWKLYRYNNFSHNTLTLNNALQSVEGYSSLITFSSDEKFLNAIMDITSPYADYVSKANRGVVILDKKIAAICDEIEFSKATLLHWKMLTPANVTIISSTEAELEQDGKKVILRVLSSDKGVLTAKPADPPQPYDKPNPGVTSIQWEVDIKIKSKVSFTILLIPYDNLEEAAQLTIPPLDNW